MNVAEYLVDYLISYGVTDAFGVPGGVILDLIYAMESRNNEIRIHLNYNEQASGFAACGNAQSGNRLGVAYATRGPGITNMLTPIAEAYYESIPVLFITAHSSDNVNQDLRCAEDQEMNIVENVQNITKFSKRVDSLDEVVDSLRDAIFLANDGRKGAVLLDINSNLFKKELLDMPERQIKQEGIALDYEKIIKQFNDEILQSKRPLILVGDGIKQAAMEDNVRNLIDQLRIPVISSRGSQDILAGNELFYGYIGSHGVRYANCIFEKADLVISLGNRMSFPTKSKSYEKALVNKEILWLDIDNSELHRNIPNCQSFFADLTALIPRWMERSASFDFSDWVEKCKEIKKLLVSYDVNEAVKSIGNILDRIKQGNIVIADVGNNEFWLSRAYEMTSCTNKIYFSKSFGTLGCALGKAIGAYYATGEHIICFVGDQGFQFNIQELQTISKNKVPICIVVINNNISSMIRDREVSKYGKEVHTTPESGYYSTDIKKIAEAYGITYMRCENFDGNILLQNDKPHIIEILVDSNIRLEPELPVGATMSEMAPKIDDILLHHLKEL